MSRSFGFERFEERRLLAADVAVDLMPQDAGTTSQCEVAELDAGPIEEIDVESETGVLDLDTTEIPVDVIDSETAVAESHDLGDPVDGTDGFFGSLDADSPSQTLAFSPSESGMIDVVVASSFGEFETRLEVSDSNGDVIASTMTEELSGFQMLSFEAEAGEAYQLTVSSEDGAEGYFQVTVDHEEISEPVDLHADVSGEDSTLLELEDGNAEIAGELELAGDVDSFRFSADATGKVKLGLTEMDPSNATELQVQVTGSDGSQVVRGITNENVGISFDVESGAEYFVAVSAGEGETGAYELGLELEAADVEESDNVSVDNGPDVAEPEVAEDNVEPTDESDGVDDTEESEPADEVAIDETGEGGIGVDETEVEISEPVELEFVDSVTSIEGELEVGASCEPVLFTAPADGEVELDLDVVSSDYSADASVSVLDEEGEPIEIGTTNEDVGIRFQVIEGDQYQVLVESLNDVPASFQLTMTLSEAESAIETDEPDSVPAEAEAEDGSLVDDAIDVDEPNLDEILEDEMDVCFADDASETDSVDAFFEEFSLNAFFAKGRGLEVRRS